MILVNRCQLGSMADAENSSSLGRQRLEGQAKVDECSEPIAQKSFALNQCSEAELRCCPGRGLDIIELGLVFSVHFRIRDSAVGLYE
jgi:hypothetical protein